MMLVVYFLFCLLVSNVFLTLPCFIISGEDEAVVNDARYDTCSRNVYNYDSLKGLVDMTRRADHIICE